MEGVAFDQRAPSRCQFGSSEPHKGEGAVKAEAAMAARTSDPSDSMVDAEDAAGEPEGTREHAEGVENDQGAKSAGGGTMSTEPAVREAEPEVAAEDAKASTGMPEGA